MISDQEIRRKWLRAASQVTTNTNQIHQENLMWKAFELWESLIKIVKHFVIIIV